jgi:DNA invertase Pin-like site-specific DNA recombinase
VFFDLGVSGGAEVSQRPGLVAALAFGAGAVVAAKRDRFARDVGIAASIERQGAKVGTRILSADGGNGDDDSDALKRDLDAVLSAHERRVIRRRTRDALAVKRARGERTGSAPFGMRPTGPDHCPACAAHASERRQPFGVHLAPEPSEQATIARALVLSNDGLTVRAIAAVLAREGYRNRAGRPLAYQSVGQFLQPLLPAQ